MEETQIIGYTTKQALGILLNDVTSVLEQHNTQLDTQTWSSQFRNSLFHHNSRRSLLHWTSCTVIVLQAILLLVAYGCSGEANRDDWLAVEALIILIVLTVNIYLLVLDQKLYNKDISDSILKALNILKVGSTKGYIWNAANYLNLNTPISSCVTVQWTYRDGEIVNLPTNLLVRGDIIVLRAGQEIHAKCKLIENPSSCSKLNYSRGEVFMIPIKGQIDGFFEPQCRIPLEPQRAVVLETPFVECVHTMLEKGTKRPDSILENELHMYTTVWVEKLAVPTAACIMLLANVLRYVLLKGHVGHWTEMLIVLQVHCILPLVPLVLPVMYKVLNLYCTAKLLATFDTARNSQTEQREVDDFSQGSSAIEEQTVVNITWSHVWQTFKQIVRGQSSVLIRTANMVHALGHVTCLCCVDKKGILSWANPSPEKVFFFTKASNTSVERNFQNSTKDEEDQAYGSDHYVEVLDLTHSSKTACGIQFDDPLYKRHIHSLKPLGLNVLLNTCNLKTAADYSQFADHVTCAALKKEDTVAVVNRRCLCNLAREIGFSDQACEIFNLQGSLGIYQHVPETTVHTIPSKSFVKHKIPMPNMMSVIEQDVTTGSSQLFSTGTADIILNCCTDFWDGADLSPITPFEKKKILDFYHRTSMSSYCTAFSYRPFMQPITDEISDVYIELAPCYEEMVHKGQTDQRSHVSLDHYMTRKLSSYHSIDSLISTHSVGLVKDVIGCYQAQNNQIFLGMVTMQYQAKQDIVQLIDSLEKASIRFIHFSKENELRSRVFSEKMGLEAGWNCHISLLSENHVLSKHSQNSKKYKKMPTKNSASEQGLDLGDPKSDSSKCDDTNLPARRLSAPSVICPVQNKKRTKSVESTSHKSPRRKTLLHIGLSDEETGSGSKIASSEHRSSIDSQSHLLAENEERQSTDDRSEDVEIVDLKQLSKSGSQGTTSDSLCGIEDLNRAKLPKGIENIRPHLDNVDNVPLLVSLFTDCTPGTTCEMIQIMQDYGEVVCCIGSSANMNSISVFIQADVSLALEPIYPHVCTKQPPVLDPWDENDPSPMDVSTVLNSLPCPLSFHRDDNVSITELICEARYSVRSIRHSLLLMISCLLSLTFIQMFGAVLLLPPILSGHHVLWLTCIVVPILSLTLMGAPVDPICITNAPYGKNKNCVKKKYVLQFLLAYSLRFLPTIVICVISYGLTLKHLCNSVVRSTTNCHGLFGYMNFTGDPGHWNGWTTEYSSGLVLAQNFVAFQLVFYFICTSLSFVHRWRSLWKRSPLLNKFWCITCPILLLIQVIYFACDVAIHNSVSAFIMNPSNIPLSVWVLSLVWPLVLIPVNELIKFHDIKLMVQHQKRERLNFGTKLGMNSPF